MPSTMTIMVVLMILSLALVVFIGPSYIRPLGVITDPISYRVGSAYHNIKGTDRDRMEPSPSVLVQGI
jgi:hypothetical protein